MVGRTNRPIPPMQGKDLILVVDDELAILRMATSALSMGGFRAVVAENGSVGFDTFMKHQAEICLVLTDVVMPAITGLDMAGRILDIDSATKILFMSGYSDMRLEVEARNQFPFIRKPFLAADLLRKVREVLGDQSEAVEA
jgi:two-component system, cell cycle sensor histidine kinase and response regulator CckA